MAADKDQMIVRRAFSEDAQTVTALYKGLGSL